MEMAAKTSRQRAVEAVEALPPDEQYEVIEIIRRRLIEQRRREIAQNAAHARADLAAGRLRSGSVDDLMADVLDEDDR